MLLLLLTDRSPRKTRDASDSDISPRLNWYPLVTILQLALMGIAITAPIGYGHVFALQDYLEVWSATPGIQDWPPQALAALSSGLVPTRQLRKETAGADRPHEGTTLAKPFPGRSAQLSISMAS